jgi:hypothetical protein
MKNPAAFLLSRNYVEFGPFSSEELTAFHSRGILLDSDYVKESGGHVWTGLSEWLGSQKPGAPAAGARKAPAKKRTVRSKSAA